MGPLNKIFKVCRLLPTFLVKLVAVVIIDLYAGTPDGRVASRFSRIGTVNGTGWTMTLSNFGVIFLKYQVLFNALFL